MDVRVFSTALICVGICMTMGWLPALGAGLIMSGLAKIQDNHCSACN